MTLSSISLKQYH